MTTLNPYQAPRAIVADVAPAARPPRITLALGLMWTSLISGTFYGMWDAGYEELGSLELALALTAVAALVLLFALPLFFIARGRNWARWLWTLAVLGGWAWSLAYWEESFAGAADIVANLFFGILDVGALCLIYSRPGADWFTIRT